MALGAGDDATPTPSSHHAASALTHSLTPKQPYLLIPDRVPLLSAYVHRVIDSQTTNNTTSPLLAYRSDACLFLYGRVIVIFHSFIHSAAILLPPPDPPISTGQHST